MGCFSWITNDTNRSIIMSGYGSKRFPCRTCYMWDNKGNCWEEKDYEGYGVFGKKDYYILLAEMNNAYDSNISEDEKRNHGVGIEFDTKNSNILYPNLTHTSIWTWKNEILKQCPEQGACDWNAWEYEEEDNKEKEQKLKQTLFQTVPVQIQMPIPKPLPKAKSKKCNEQLLIDKTHIGIKKKYTVINYKEGEIIGEFVSRNPVWIVKEKNDAECIYDTTMVIMYCQGASFAKMSVPSYQKLLDFEKKYNDKFVLYHHVVSGPNIIKGHCSNPANMEALNNTIISIISVAKSNTFVRSNY